MDDLLSEFIAETQETLEALAGEVVAWEADPSDRDRLDAIFRFFHTVKGSCGFLNLPRFEKLSHAAEDVLSDLRSGARMACPATVGAVLAVMDRIGELASAVASGAGLPSEDDDLLIDALQQRDAADDGAEGDDLLVSPEAPAARQRRPGAPSVPRTIRLPLSLIDQLMNGVSDMVLARNELSRKLRDRAADPDLESAFERLSACVADMRDAISKTRMQRVDRLFAAIPRMVRDLSRDLGKKVELTLDGGDVEMDREMVEMVVDPLTHIVRNAIDHGIEAPEARRAADKPETGSLRVSARQSGNQIVIETSDDGRGIDTAKLVAKAVSAGALTTQAAARLTEKEKLDLIFAPGLSTAAQVTAISGRGVGMDVVRANVERIGGVIALENVPGRGLRIILRVPLTLTIIPGLIVRAGDQHFALPRAAVVEILHDNNAMLSIDSVGGARMATIRAMRHSMIDLEDVLGLPKLEQPGPRTLMVVRSASGNAFAIGVAAVENHEELVIRPASPLIMASGVFAGMTLPDNGRPMLLLDASGIASKAGLASSIEAQAASAAAQPEQREDARETMSALRFTEISGEDRLLRLSLIERVEDIAVDCFGCSGGRAFARVDGRLMPVANGLFRFEGSHVTALRLRDGDREICYPIAHVADIVQAPVAPEMRLSRGIVGGVTVVEGQHVEMIDPFALFAAIPCEPIVEASASRCVIADADDAWAREILAPLLAQAGHEVAIGLREDEMLRHDDIVLSTGFGAAVPLPEDRPVIRLRATERPQGAADASIYRYDRDALIAAIEAARQGRAA
jgi:two-component system chemotaxis sensor kinase CheA